VWYDFWTAQSFTGGSSVKVEAPLSTIPCFVKAGSVLPTQRTVQFVGDGRIDTLILNVYPAEPGAPTVSSLYQDDGSSFAYTGGAFARRTFKVSVTPTTETCDLSAVEGSYCPLEHVLHFRFLHTPAAPIRVQVNDTVIPRYRPEQGASRLSTWTHSLAEKRIDLYIENLPIARRIELTYEH
jgi:hypothetical protein